jgi:hypothetical protein
MYEYSMLVARGVKANRRKTSGQQNKCNVYKRTRTMLYVQLYLYEYPHMNDTVRTTHEKNCFTPNGLLIWNGRKQYSL